jgi:protein KTI12
MITGYPTSGKTYRSKQLYDYFVSRSSSPDYSSSSTLRVHHITDIALSISHTVYDLSSKSAHERSANASEKDARARVYAEVKRLLSSRDVVILDAAAGNYIKGWRYQLFCEAKAVRTPSCVVHVGANQDQARKINEERLVRRERGEDQVEGEEPYEKETWDNLVFRYEEPNGMTRWDSPLFTVPFEDEKPDFEAIWEALLGEGNIVKPNAATVQSKVVEEGYLYKLDRVTQEVVAKILEWTKDHEGEEGGIIDFDEEKKPAKKTRNVDDDEQEEDTSMQLQLPQSKLGLPALQRLRRQYISLQRVTPSGAGRIKAGFIGFLNTSFEDI